MTKGYDERTFVNAEIDGAGNVVRTKEHTIRYFDDENGYLFWLNKEAVKTFKGFGLPKDLSETDTARVYRLSLVTHKGSNLICYRSGNVVRGMSCSKIADYLSISKRQAANFLGKMIDRRIIGKVRVQIGDCVETQYYINPIYFFNGKWLNYNLYFLFKKDLDGLLPEWVKLKFNQDLSQSSR